MLLNLRFNIFWNSKYHDLKFKNIFDVLRVKYSYNDGHNSTKEETKHSDGYFDDRQPNRSTDSESQG